MKREKFENSLHLIYAQFKTFLLEIDDKKKVNGSADVMLSKNCKWFRTKKEDITNVVRSIDRRAHTEHDQRHE